VRALAALALALACALAQGQVSDPAEVGPPNPRLGDRWNYVITAADGASTKMQAEVTSVSPEGVTIRRGSNNVLYSRPWVMTGVVTAGGSISYEPGVDTIPFPLRVGRVLNQNVTLTFQPAGNTRVDETVTTVVGWEDVIVPAGIFRAIRVQRTDVMGAGTPEAREFGNTYWYSPELRNHVQVENVPAPGRRILIQLESYKVD
jgi:hypothetical protein